MSTCVHTVAYDCAGAADFVRYLIAEAICPVCTQRYVVHLTVPVGDPQPVPTMTLPVAEVNARQASPC